MDRIIGVTDIEKRRRLRNRDDQTRPRFPIMEYRRLSEALKENRSDVSYLIHDYYRSLSLEDGFADGEYFIKPFEILKETPEYTEKEMIREMIPLLGKIDDFYTLEQSLDCISEIDSIVEEVNRQKACDRFINNDEKLNKRFNLQKFFVKNQFKSMEYLIQETCHLIDTYDIPSYGKFQCAVEEIVYQLDRLGCDYKKESVLEGVGEYYTEESEDLDDLMEVVEESKFFSKKDKNQFKSYVKKEKERLSKVEAKEDTGAKVKYVIDKFKEDETKDMNKLTKIFYNMYHTDPQAIVDGTSSIVTLVGTLSSITSIGINPIVGIIRIPVDALIKARCDEKATNKMIKKFKREKKRLEKQLTKKNLPKEKRKQIRDTIHALDDAIDRMWDYRDRFGDSKPFDDLEEGTVVTFTEANNIIEPVYEYYTLKESADEISKAILSVHEFHNMEIPHMISLQESLYAYLNRRDKIYDYLQKHCTLLYENTITRRQNILEEGYVGEDYHVDACILICEAEEDHIAQVVEYLEDACDAINGNTVLPVRAYVEGYDGLFEIHIIDGASLLLEEAPCTLSGRDYYYLESLEQYEVLTEGDKLNNLKLTAMGMMKKAKDLGSKSQETARNISAKINHFTQSMKEAEKADRREAIIKGSVIPSFRSLLKVAIPAVGLGVLNPILGIVTAFCSFAHSKALTREEKFLLMDEIDIELKVIERELEKNPEDNGKYRKLLMAKKKLQREKIRLKYNLKGGKNHLSEDNLKDQEYGNKDD